MAQPVDISKSARKDRRCNRYFAPAREEAPRNGKGCQPMRDDVHGY